MSIRSLPSSSAVPDPPAVRTYGSLFLLLAVYLLPVNLGMLTEGAAATWLLDVFGRQAVGAGVAVVAAAVTLVGVDFLSREFSTPIDGLDRYERVQLGATLLFVVFVAAYGLYGALDLPVFPGDTVQSLLYGPVQLGLLAVAYTRLRGIDLRTALPDREQKTLVARTVLVVTLLSVPVTAGLYATFASPVEGFRQSVTPAVLLWEVLLPAAFLAFGWAVLFNGAIQAELRERLGPTAAVGAVTTLMGAAFLASGEVLRISGSALTVVAVSVAGALTVLGAVGTARGLGVVSQSLDRDPSQLLSAVVGVLAVAAISVPVILLRGYHPTFVLHGVFLATVAAVGAVAYERSHTVWVPAIGFAVYLLATDVQLVRFLLG